MMPTHAWSWAHVCVTPQHLDMTQLAHEVLEKAIPHAAVMPPPLPPPPLPPPPPPPLDPLPWPEHALLQLPWTQVLIPSADDRHEGLTVAFARHASDIWAEALYWPFGQ
jgi:hypothetical protein